MIRVHDIFMHKHTKRFVVVRSIQPTAREPDLSYVDMWRLRKSDGVAWGNMVVAIVRNETHETPDDLPSGYSRPEIVPDNLIHWSVE